MLFGLIRTAGPVETRRSVGIGDRGKQIASPKSARLLVGVNQLFAARGRIVGAPVIAGQTDVGARTTFNDPSSRAPGPGISDHVSVGWSVSDHVSIGWSLIVEDNLAVEITAAVNEPLVVGEGWTCESSDERGCQREFNFSIHDTSPC
jgi:hypothetical protein